MADDARTPIAALLAPSVYAGSTIAAMLARDPYRPGKIAEIEHAMIGACLIDARGIKAWPLLNPEEFWMERHRKIWAVMLELAEGTDNPDPLLVANELDRRNELEEVGGIPKLAQMTEAAINVTDIGYYGRCVREAAKEREKIMLAAALFQRPDMSSSEIEAVLAKLETGSAIRAPLLSESWLAEQERLRQNPPVKTGYRALDSLIQGCSRGKMIIVGGRTSHGKTSFLTDFTRRAARNGHSVDYLSLEETASGVHARWIAQEAALPVWAVSQGRLGPIDRARADDAVEELQVLPLTALTVKRPDEASIVAAVKASRAEIFVFDHLQMAVMSGREPRTYALERLLNRIAYIGVADNKIVIVASQLSREMDKRRDRPVLGDLRDSGGTEQAGRLILLLYWPRKYHADKDPSYYEVEVAKHTEGPTGSVTLTFDAVTGRFHGGEGFGIRRVPETASLF